MSNIGDIKLDATAWYDPNTDTVKIKVRRFYTDSQGRLIKRGVMFKFSEEVFTDIGEGCEYPVVKAEGAERFVQIAEEIEDES